ncbi:MAG: RpiB/LacA/LacB family sugar-phosphate isomerase [Actinobacteria bacterium]|nr:RpiB/LacA/LacB family sugar-phosphate isomerase [Actinomycetota bacterium]
MIVAVGADHGGYTLKTSVVAALRAAGHETLDLGAFDEQPSDYPDFALAVAEAVRAGKAERGVVVCGSGVGACVAANKVPGIRAGIAHDTFSAHQGVEDDDMNVVCLGARVIGRELALEVVRTFLGARFSGAERHVRRLAKVREIEKRFASDEE